MGIFSIVSSDGVFTITVGGSSSSAQTAKSKSKSTNANVPSQRMKPGLAISKGTLYLYGGEYESGSKQYTLNDFYALGKFCNGKINQLNNLIFDCLWHLLKCGIFKQIYINWMNGKR